MNDVLTNKQRVAADRVLAEEETRHRHLVVSLSGAHAYGFPSPDSDLDLLVTTNHGRARLLRNDGGNRHNALRVKLVGTASNRDWVAARRTSETSTSLSNPLTLSGPSERVST